MHPVWSGVCLQKGNKENDAPVTDNHIFYEFN